MPVVAGMLVILACHVQASASMHGCTGVCGSFCAWNHAWVFVGESVLGFIAQVFLS